MALLPEIIIDTEASKITFMGRNLTDDNVVDVVSKLPKCKVLHMRFSSLGDDGMKALLRSGVINQVQRLRLSSANIGDEGALALVRSSATNNIVELTLEDVRVSVDGLVAVAENLPGTKIIRFVCYSKLYPEPTVLSRIVHEAFYKAALNHKLLTMCEYGHISFYDPVNNIDDNGTLWLLGVALTDNINYTRRVREELREAVDYLGCGRDVNYLVQMFGPDIMQKFEQFLFNPELSVELGKDPTVCKRVLRYISDNYFRITGIVCGSLECDGGSSTSLSSLPPEVLREITKFLKITDVKTES